MSLPPRDQAGIAALTRRILDAADWPALAEIYFHDNGEALWRERRARVIELGCELGEQLLARLPKDRGASLWVGAGVAELPVLLAEVLLHGRQVVAANLIERECAVLNAALLRAAPDVPLCYLPGDAREVAPDRRFDHLGCISVFTDPEIWPALSGVAYGRLPPVQLDLEQFAAERERARELAEGLFARLQLPAWVTTTAEEVAWFLERAELHGCGIEPCDELVETAVVGDPVGFLQLR